MKKVFGILVWALILPLLSAGFSWGKVYIDITSPSFRKLPIAIAPFESALGASGEMKLGERATDILTHDLDLTGFFALIDSRNSGEKIGQTPPGKLPETEDFRKWANAGAEALILGQVSYQDRSLTLEARLYDVVKKEMIVGKRYRGVDLVEYALNMNLAKTLHGLIGKAQFELRELLELYLRRYDQENLTTILRGKLSGVPAQEVREALIPAGSLKLEQLHALIDASYDDTLEMLRRLGRGYIVDLLTDRPLPEVEDEMRRHYFRELLEATAGRNGTITSASARRLPSGLRT